MHEAFYLILLSSVINILFYNLAESEWVWKQSQAYISQCKLPLLYYTVTALTTCSALAKLNMHHLLQFVMNKKKTTKKTQHKLQVHGEAVSVTGDKSLLNCIFKLLS